MESLKFLRKRKEADASADPSNKRTEKYGLFRLRSHGDSSCKAERNEENICDIAAVHGITGDAYNTWVHSNGTFVAPRSSPEGLTGYLSFYLWIPCRSVPYVQYWDSGHICSISIGGIETRTKRERGTYMTCLVFDQKYFNSFRYLFLALT